MNTLSEVVNDNLRCSKIAVRNKVLLTNDAVGCADGVPHAADERYAQKVLHGLPSHLETLRLCADKYS